MNTIQEYFDYARLSQAAYAEFAGQYSLPQVQTAGIRGQVLPFAFDR